jgi:hypothetical protein
MANEGWDTSRKFMGCHYKSPRCTILAGGLSFVDVHVETGQGERNNMSEEKFQLAI